MAQKVRKVTNEEKPRVSTAQLQQRLTVWITSQIMHMSTSPPAQPETTPKSPQHQFSQLAACVELSSSAGAAQPAQEGRKLIWSMESNEEDVDYSVRAGQNTPRA